jgi:two-component system response regulator AtoC
MARILVVDDEEGIRAFLADSLVTEGHEVFRAADGAEAASLLERQAFHLMITDLRMPGMDGLALLDRARREVPEMEVVVLTAHGTVDTAVDAMKLGAVDYLQKPLSGPEEIRLVAARAVERCSLKTLASRVDGDDPTPALTFGAPAMTPVVEVVRRVAPTDAPVLLTGETGTGKEVVARAIHNASRRADGPFVAVNCAALSDTLLESELFGHERGAFTGAEARRRGRIELAEGGTFFLDEIGELRPELQAKLLRVLQEKQFQRVGGQRTLIADVRWIAATNRNLGERMREGAFRDDLYHRLAVFPVEIPPLRRRREDIVPLAEHLLQRIARDQKKPLVDLAPDAEELLREADWPGNVRELANVLERAVILSDSPCLTAAELGLSGGANAASPPRGGDETLESIERRAIERALRRAGGHRERAATELGIGLRTLYDKIKRYGL